MKKLTTRQAIRAMADHFDIKVPHIGEYYLKSLAISGLDTVTILYHFGEKWGLHVSSIKFYIRQQQLSGKI